MELKEYLKIFQKRKKIIFESVFALTVFTVAFSLLKPMSYDNDLVLLVSRNGAQETSDYKYDGYYALEASDAFADNVSQWLASASLAKEIYLRAKIESNPASLAKFSKLFKAKKLSSQYVEVRYGTPDTQSAVALAHAAVDVLQEKADAIRAASNEEISFKIIYSDPFTIRSPNNVLLNGFLALVSGLILGIFLALGKEYFNKN